MAKKRAPSIQEIFLNGESWKANHEFNDRDVIELSYVIDKYNNEKVYLNFKFTQKLFPLSKEVTFKNHQKKLILKLSMNQLIS